MILLLFFFKFYHQKSGLYRPMTVDIWDIEDKNKYTRSSQVLLIEYSWLTDHQQVWRSLYKQKFWELLVWKHSGVLTDFHLREAIIATYQSVKVYNAISKHKVQHYASYRHTYLVPYMRCIYLLYTCVPAFHLHLFSFVCAFKLVQVKWKKRVFWHVKHN